MSLPPTTYRRALGVGAALTSAGLYGLAFPPYSLPACAWIALVPILLVMGSAPAREAYGLAGLFALCACGLCIGWIAPAAATYYAQPLYVGIAVFLGIALLMVVPHVLVFVWLYRRYRRLRPAWATLLAACAWVASELARSKLLSGNPFALIAYSQSTNLPLIQVSDLAGIHGVSFLLMLSNAGLAEAAARVWRRQGLAAAGRALVLVGAVLAAALGYGWRQMAPRDEVGAAQRILLVQGNLDLGAQWHAEFYGRNLDLYLKDTLAGLGAGGVRLVLWPESAMTFFVEQELLYRQALGIVLTRGPVELISGGPRSDVAGPETYFNSAFLLAPDGSVRGHYDKQQLLPFAEYWPLPQFDVLRRDFGRVREFTPGRDTLPLATAIGAAGVLICNEAMFPELASRATAVGAEWLVNLTNDTWIGDPRYGLMAAEMTVFRAVEQRRWLVRASTSGPSLIVDPNGRIQAQAPPSTRTTLVGEIHARSERTPYARFGDLFAGLSSLAAWLGALGRSPRREPPTST